MCLNLIVFCKLCFCDCVRRKGLVHETMGRWVFWLSTLKKELTGGVRRMEWQWMEGLAQKLKIKLLNLMSRCLVLAGSMHFRAWSGGFVISPVEYLPLWGLQPCLHGLWLLVLKWVCVISLIQFRKDMFHEFSWCFRCCKTIFQWTVGCWCLRGWPSGFFYPLHESWNLWVFIIGIIYFSWTNSFSENPQGPCTLTHQIFIMMCNEKHLLGVCRTFWKTGWCFQSGLVYSAAGRNGKSEDKNCSVLCCIFLWWGEWQKNPQCGIRCILLIRQIWWLLPS